MKLFKKVSIALGAIIVVLVALYFIGTGFRKVSSVYIASYELSPDGTQMTIHTGVAASVGYIRKVESHQEQDGTLCLDFYSAFGGINGSIGAQEKYIIPLNESTNKIAVYCSDTYYEPVIEKTDSGEWQLLLRRE